MLDFFLTDDDINNYLSNRTLIYELSLKYCVTMSFVLRGLNSRRISLPDNKSVVIYFSNDEIERYINGEIGADELATIHNVSFDRMIHELLRVGASWERHARIEANESSVIIKDNEQRALSKISTGLPKPKSKRLNSETRTIQINLFQYDIDDYITNRISVVDLAKLYNVSRDPMYKHLRSMGIFVNKNPKNTSARFKLSEDDVHGYLSKLISLTTLAEKHGVSIDAIKSRLANTKLTLEKFSAQSITAGDIALYKNGDVNLSDLTNKYETTQGRMICALVLLGIYH